MAAEPPSRKKVKAEQTECDKIVNRVRAGVTATPAELNQLVLRFLRDRPQCACEIVRAAAFALPKKEGQVDVAALAALIKAVLETIYADLPLAREDVSCIVGSVLDALDPDGGKPDPRGVVQILASAIPVVMANDPGLVDSIFREVTARFPGAAALISQFRADLISPLNTTFNRTRTRTETQAVEPNLQEPATAINAPN